MASLCHGFATLPPSVQFRKVTVSTSLTRCTVPFGVFLFLTEHVREAVVARVQGSGGAEIPLHPSPLQRQQGIVGLDDPPGDVLRGGDGAI